MRALKIIELLRPYITDARWSVMQKVVAQRTHYVTVVLEEIFQEHNVSAAVRSVEAFGIQNIHSVEHNRFSARKGISKGAEQWITLNRYGAAEDGIARCCGALRERGYRIVATTPHDRGIFLHELPVDQKIALIFGTEETGVSSYVRENADAFVTIPMYGFTESFNISVSVALCLYDIMQKVRALNPQVWQLSEAEQQEILATWLMSGVRGASSLVERYGL